MKVWIIGPPGSGKSTLACRLAQELRLPLVELDELYWLPGWKMREKQDFVGRVRSALDQDSWIVDGNYTAAAPLIAERADLLLWLDLPLWRTYPRVVRRTFARLLFRRELWSGNRESVSNVFGKDGMLWYSLARHRRNQDRFRSYWETFPSRKLRLTNSSTSLEEAIRACRESPQPS
jgi:adenylate kinase family enzyme